MDGLIPPIMQLTQSLNQSKGWTISCAQIKSNEALGGWAGWVDEFFSPRELLLCFLCPWRPLGSTGILLIFLVPRSSNMTSEVDLCSSDMIKARKLRLATYQYPYAARLLYYFRMRWTCYSLELDKRRITPTAFHLSIDGGCIPHFQAKFASHSILQKIKYKSHKVVTSECNISRKPQ